MNVLVEDLSAIRHTDDLMSGIIDPDDITYGYNGKTEITKIPTSFDTGGMPDLPDSMKTSSSGGGGGGFSMDNIDPELINAAISTTGTLIGMAGSKKTEVERVIKNICGRRPILRKNRPQYTECASRVLQDYMMQNAPRTGWDNRNQNTWGRPQRQGLSTGAVIGIVAGGVLLTAVIVMATKKKA
jgi:hypothetical protein